MAFSESTGSDGIMFAGDGPVMSGTWQNPQTGHKFTVRDSFFQDGQLMVQTTDGQLLDYNTIQNYIQCTDDKGNNVNVPTQTPMPGTKKKQGMDVPSEVSSMVLPEGPAGAGEDEFLTAEDMAMVKGLGSLNGPSVVSPERTRAMAAPISEDYKMIDRVLSRHSIPELNAEIVWPNAPKKQIDTLVDILGVNPEEIADYYISKLDRNAVFEAMKVGVAKYIKDILMPQDIKDAPQIVKDAPQIVKEPTSTKGPKKKSKTKK